MVYHLVSTTKSTYSRPSLRGRRGRTTHAGPRSNASVSVELIEALRAIYRAAFEQKSQRFEWTPAHSLAGNAAVSAATVAALGAIDPALFALQVGRIAR